MKATDIKTFSAQLQEAMRSRLETVAQENKDPMARISKSLVAVKASLDELKQVVNGSSFESKARQIEFFKEIKPLIASQYFYYKGLFDLKLHEPADPPDLKQFYSDELATINKYLVKHKDFYAYCLSGAIQLDELYFVSHPATLLNPDLDTRFSTGFDTILAKILANQLLKEHIENATKALGFETTPLTWTSKKAHLIELIYALHAVKVFNNGAAEIKQIATIFEKLFSVDLGDVYRRFSEVSIRKKSQTTFIDQLKTTLEKKLDDML